MKLTQKDALIGLFGFVVIICVGYLIYKGIEKKNSLYNNIEYAAAVIVDITSGPRMRHYFDYKFSVNKKEYHGSGSYYPKSDTLFIGDAVTVVYDSVDPDNNKTYRDYKQIQEETPFIIPFIILMGVFLWWRYRKM